MTVLGALCIYWAVVLVLIGEARRELVTSRTRRRRVTVLLHAGVAVAAGSAVVLTAWRLVSGS